MRGTKDFSQPGNLLRRANFVKTEVKFFRLALKCRFSFLWIGHHHGPNIQRNKVFQAPCIILPGHYEVYSPPPPPPLPFGSALRCAWLSCKAGQSCTAKNLTCESGWFGVDYLVNRDRHTDPVLPHQHCDSINSLPVSRSSVWKFQPK